MTSNWYWRCILSLHKNNKASDVTWNKMGNYVKLSMGQEGSIMWKIMQLFWGRRPLFYQVLEEENSIYAVPQTIGVQRVTLKHLFKNQIDDFHFITHIIGINHLVHYINPASLFCSNIHLEVRSFHLCWRLGVLTANLSMWTFISCIIDLRNYNNYFPVLHSQE